MNMPHDDIVVRVLALADRWWGMHRRVNSGKANGDHIVEPVWHGTLGRTRFVNWSLENGFDYPLILDRRNNNGNYSPDNCQWITQKENVSKEIRNLEYKGDFYTQTELVDLFAHSSITIYCFRGRMKAGWPLEEALSRPSNHGNSWARGSRQCFQS